MFEMTTYNTGNPLGSSHPKDLYDNAENLDTAVNDTSRDTWRDRMGRSRLTWEAIAKAGTGDTGVAIDAANRAVGAAGQAENEADRAAGAASRAENAEAIVDAANIKAEVDRAEAARDAAFVNADVYPDIAAGLAAVADGEQFQIISDNGLELIRYQRTGTGTTEVARYPSAEALEANGMFTPTSIPYTGVDFNTLTEYGVYRVSSGDRWDLSTNTPPEVYQWAVVMVIPSSPDVIFQYVFCINANVLYIRSASGLSNWSDWKKLSGDADVLQSALVAAQAAADTKVNGLEARLPDIVDSHLSPKFEIISKNFFDPSAIVFGKTIAGNGVIREDRPNGVLSGVIDVTGKTILYVSGLQASTEYRAIVFWKEDGTIAGVQSIAPNLTERSFNIPPSWGAVKAQMCIKAEEDTYTLDTSTIQFEFSATKTEYEPYKRGRLESLYGVDLTYPIKPDERPIRSRAFGASYLIFGDSITETSRTNSGIFDETSYYKNWPTWAAETLQMGTFRNYAKSGAGFRDRGLEPRYQYLYNQVIDAIANNENPDVIVVACGTNDRGGDLGTYEAAMSKATLEELDQLKTLEAARWVFWKLRLQYPDAVCFFANPLQRMADTTEEAAPLVDGLSKIAQRHGFILIDQHRESGIIRELEVSSGPGKYLSDGLHPNDEGRKRQANLIVSRIVSYMAY